MKHAFSKLGIRCLRHRHFNKNRPYKFVPSKRSMLKIWFLLYQEMHANVMEQENLLITSVPLTMVINPSTFLRTFTPKNLNIKWSIKKHKPLFLTLKLDITIKDEIFIYKLFDKRDKFPFVIVRMPHFFSIISSSIFHSLFYSELLRIAGCTLLFSHFTPKALELYNRTIL